MYVTDVVIIILEEQLPGWGVCPLCCSVGFGGSIKSLYPKKKKKGIIILVWYMSIFAISKFGWETSIWYMIQQAPYNWKETKKQYLNTPD